MYNIHMYVHVCCGYLFLTLYYNLPFSLNDETLRTSFYIRTQSVASFLLNSRMGHMPVSSTMEFES